MMKRFVLPVVLGLGLVAPALAEDLVPWGKSGAWTILRDPNHGNGCLVQTELSDGTFLRIGFGKKGDGIGYIASFNPAWSVIEPGKNYEVTVNFGVGSFIGLGKGDRDQPVVVTRHDAGRIRLRQLGQEVEGQPGLR